MQRGNSKSASDQACLAFIEPLNVCVNSGRKDHQLYESDARSIASARRYRMTLYALEFPPDPPSPFLHPPPSCPRVSVEESAASESQPARAAASASGGEAPEEGDERRKDKRPAEQQPDSGSGDEEVTRSISRKRLEGTGPQTRAEESSVASMDTGTTASSSNLIGGGGRGSVEADTAMSESSALLESRTTAEARVEQGTRPPASDNLPAGQPTTGADPAAPAGQPTIEAESAAPAGQPTPGAESATPAGQPTPGGEQALPTVPSWAEFYEEVHRLLFVPLDAAEVHSLERAEAKTAASRAYAQWPRISAAPAGKVASSESSSSSEEEDEQEEQEDDEDSEERGEGGAMEQDFELALESDVVALQALGIPPPTNSTEINQNSHDDSSSSGVPGGLKLAMPPRSGTENAPKQTVHVDTPRDDGFDWDTVRAAALPYFRPSWGFTAASGLNVREWLLVSFLGRFFLFDARAWRSVQRA